MSSINLEWLYNHFSDNENLIIFDIGCADCSDSIRFKLTFPDAIVYSFECNDYFLKDNLQKANEFDLIYNHIALDAVNGRSLFYPGLKETGEPCHWSGTLIPESKTLSTSGMKLGAPCEVDTVSINDFCVKNQICPTFIHIDAESKEKDILTNLSKQFLPELIWAEHDWYDSPYVLDQALDNNYRMKYRDVHDTLYERLDCNSQQYVPFASIPGKIHLWEQKMLEKHWIDSYNKIKDASWPDLKQMSDFNKLPDYIQKECREHFNFDVDKKLLS